MRIRNFSDKNRWNYAALLLALGIMLSACHHKIDPTASPNFTQTPTVKPTTELEYLIAQSQLPKSLRSDSHEVILNTRDTSNHIRIVANHEDIASSSSGSTSNNSVNNPTASSQENITTENQTSTSDNTTSADALLSVNPTHCEWAAKDTPFKGAYASETWTSHNNMLYTIIITSHAIDLEWVRDELHKCTHFQVHRLSSVQTIDREYQHNVLLSAPVIVEYTTTTSSSTGDSQQKEITQSFTRRLITTLPNRNVSIQINATIDHPFTEDEIVQENNVLVHQIKNIPQK